MAPIPLELIIQNLQTLTGETDIHSETQLKNDLALDSLEMVQLILHLNQLFGTTLSSADILPEHFHNVATLARLVESKQKARG
jgi:acyl carrier protein